MSLSWPAVKRAILRTEGDVHKTLGDFVVFFGYFILSFYAGGNSYLRAYGDSFGIDLIDDPASLKMVATFISEVLGEFWILALCFGVVLIYFLSRYVLAFWLGFLLTATTLLLALAAFSELGERAGERQAHLDKLGRSEIPSIAFTPPEGLEGEFTGSGWRILHQDDDRLYLFQEQGSPGSAVLVHSVKKSLLDSYRITTRW